MSGTLSWYHTTDFYASQFGPKSKGNLNNCFGCWRLVLFCFSKYVILLFCSTSGVFSLLKVTKNIRGGKHWKGDIIFKVYSKKGITCSLQWSVLAAGIMPPYCAFSLPRILLHFIQRPIHKDIVVGPIPMTPPTFAQTSHFFSKCVIRWEL